MAHEAPQGDALDESRGRSTAAQPGQPRRSLLAAILRQRCPRCREGRIFRGAITMNDPCPACRLVFEREPGYFFGAMYISYGLAILILTPLFFLFLELLPGQPTLLILLLTTLPYLPLVPLVFRYSRVLWIYFDRVGESPSPTEAVPKQAEAKQGQQGSDHS